MTHVVSPYSHRLGIIRDWRSRWYMGGKEYAEALRGDILLREFLNKKLRGMYIADTIIERGKDTFKISIHTSRPGMIIGRSGDGIEKIKADILKEIKRKKLNIPLNFKLDIVEVSSPEASAAIVGYMVAEALEKRLPFRRVLKSTVEKVMANRDVQGVRIAVAGRLGGAEMARREEIRKGNVPLQTLRADVDFCKERANMTYGVIGIKVWIYRGMKFDNNLSHSMPANNDSRRDDNRRPRSFDRNDRGSNDQRRPRNNSGSSARPRSPRSNFTRTKRDDVTASSPNK